MEFTAAGMFAMLVVSTAGFSFFLYGKKQARVPQLVAGCLLMVLPYFVGSAVWMSLAAGLVMLALWGACRAGC